MECINHVLEKHYFEATKSGTGCPKEYNLLDMRICLLEMRSFTSKVVRYWHRNEVKISCLQENAKNNK